MKNFFITHQLKKMRMTKGLSRRSLSERCCVSEKTIQRAEEGRRIHVNSVKKLAKGLDTDLNNLINTEKTNKEGKI